MFAWRDNYISYNGAANDPYWTSVSLLLNYETPQTGFIDGSTNNFALTAATGTAAPKPNLSTPFTGSGASMYFLRANATFITVPDNVAFYLTGDFTWEAWVYPTSFAGANGNIIASQWPGAVATNCAWQFQITSTGRIAIVYGIGGTNTLVAGTTLTCTVNVWQHVAITRSGTTVRFFRNGVADATTPTVSGALNDSTSVVNVGRINATDTGYFSGFMSNLRIVKGTALYTAGFTPPTSPLTAVSGTSLLLNFTNQGQQQTSATVYNDQGPNSFAITAGNTPSWAGLSPFTNTYPGSIGLVSASSQSLTVATNAAFTYGTGDFTIECWFYLNSTGAIQYLIDQRNSGTATAIIPTLYIDASNFLVYFVNGAVRIQGATALSSSTWYSVSVSRTSTSTKMFLNGTQEGSTYSDSNNYAASRVVIGSNAATAGSYLNGYISNIRLSKGFAYYTTTYTPSTIPLTSSATYTSLLISGNTGSLYDLSNNGNKLTAAQNTQTQVYKYGTQAGLTTTGITTVTDATNLQFGTGDFTIEGWIYRNSSGVVGGIISKGTSTTGWRVRVNASNQLVFATTTTDVQTSTTTIAATTWTYFAWTRSGTTNYMFINGTQEGSTFTDSTNFNQTNNLLVGSDGVNTTLQGYMDEVRLTKGVCRYTATFTAPTSAFPTS